MYEKKITQITYKRENSPSPELEHTFTSDIISCSFWEEIRILLDRFWWVKTSSVNPTFHLSALGETLLESQMILDSSPSFPFLRV